MNARWKKRLTTAANCALAGCIWSVWRGKSERCCHVCQKGKLVFGDDLLAAVLDATRSTAETVGAVRGN